MWSRAEWDLALEFEPPRGQLKKKGIPEKRLIKEAGIPDPTCFLAITASSGWYFYGEIVFKCICWGVDFQNCIFRGLTLYYSFYNLLIEMGRGRGVNPLGVYLNINDNDNNNAND